ncbi:MAG: response regulator transcription factor [Lachnospiraceae bacterium]|nr:response regulator transcription factor [Lachnospiraceae bacterium]
MEKLLLVEDDSALVRRLTEYLSAEGFRCISAGGQTQAVTAIDAEQPDLALVDITLAEGNGFAVCAYARGKGVPVIFLTASSDELSTVTGLDMGADDYIAKPFRPKELVSRIRSVLRRSSGNHGEIALGELRVDSGKGLVFRADRQIFLSALEYRLFMFFLNHRGQVLTREQLLDEIWDSAGEYVSDNTLTVYIKRLREKLEEDPQDPRLILTVRGIGYQLKE